jgi:hypothetical protein
MPTDRKTQYAISEEYAEHMEDGSQSLPMSPHPVKGEVPSPGKTTSQRESTQSLSPFDRLPSMISSQSIAPLESRIACTPSVVELSPAEQVVVLRAFTWAAGAFWGCAALVAARAPKMSIPSFNIVSSY